MTLLSRLMPNNDPASSAQALVNERNVHLAANSKITREIARLNEQLKICCEAVNAANPALAATLHSAEAPMNAEEMSRMLKILVLATHTDLQGLSQDLGKMTAMRKELEKLLEIWDRVEGDYDAAIASGSNALTMDRKNIEDLTALRAQVQDRLLGQT